MSGPVDLSLVVPLYNERDNLPLLIEEIGRALGRIGSDYEIVAVDDGSTDGSLDALKELRRDHPELHIVALAARAGQSAAFAAGFRAACGRTIVTLDADLQNDPADIPALLAELERSGATAVVGYRVNRQDGGWKRLQSRVANAVRNRLNGETIVRHRPRRLGTTKYGMWNRVFRSLADALAVRWMQRRALRYRVREELP